MEDTSSQKLSAKKGVSLEDRKKCRESTVLAVRKDKKEESLKKRRQTSAPDAADAAPLGGFPAPSSTVLTTQPSTSKEVPKLSDIPNLMQGLRSSDTATQIVSLRGFRRLLSIEKVPPVSQCEEAGAIPIFVQFLQRSDSVELQFEAAWALTNIASTDRTRLVVESMAVPYLAQLLNSPNAETREQCAWCLGNVAGDGPELRDVVLASNSMSYLLANIAQPANISMLRNCTWALSNFCRGKPAPPLAHILPALSLLGSLLLQCTDEDTVVDATWAFSYISDGENARIQAVVDQNVVPRLIQMLYSPKHQVITPALRTLGNIVSGNDAHTQAVVDGNVLAALVPLLANSRKNIRKEACWMASNIAAGTESQMTLVLQTPGLLQSVLEQLSSAAEFDVRKEAAWVVSNLATGGKERQLMQLVDGGAIKPLCDLLDLGDTKVTTLAMESLEAILKALSKCPTRNIVQMMDEAGGIDKIEALQEHEVDAVYRKAVSMIEEYFSADGDESENLAPAAVVGANGVNQFAFGMPVPPADKNGFSLGPPGAPGDVNVSGVPFMGGFRF